ncbi:MAG: inorganic phosphate transporter [Clostridia bacterium]|nr:inorganic phosphate transporter [Clostridia bacterium]MBQ7789400.1 inorganic phosphate transporter [Clostridia bacterium]
MNFFANFDTPISFLTFFLLLGVIFVNGWTDAPNSICSAVSTKALKLSHACIIACIFNFLGVLISYLLGAEVAKSIFSLVSFNSVFESQIGICATFLSVIIFGVGAWLFAMPSSESHAMISSLFGACLALGGKMSGMYLSILKIIFYMLVSCVFCFFLSFIIARLFLNKQLQYKKLQIYSCALCSFMHGSQDGQKFIGILMLLYSSSSREASVPIYIVAIVSIMMCLGTLLGGERIIKSLGENTVKLDTRSGFVSDLSSIVTLGACSFFGMPVSTGNVKSSSVIGAGIAYKEKINKKTASEIIIASLATFPICFLLGYFLSMIIFYIA